MTLSKTWTLFEQKKSFRTSRRIYIHTKAYVYYIIHTYVHITRVLYHVRSSERWRNFRSTDSSSKVPYRLYKSILLYSSLFGVLFCGHVSFIYALQTQKNVNIDSTGTNRFCVTTIIIVLICHRWSLSPHATRTKFILHTNAWK